MRAIITAASGVFVILGALIFLVSTPKVLSAFGSSQGLDTNLLIMGGGVWLASAFIILIGGTAYMLTQIDQKLEVIAGLQGRNATNSSPNYNPIDDHLG